MYYECLKLKQMFDMFNSFSLHIFLFLTFKLSDKYKDYRHKQNRPGFCLYEAWNWWGGEIVNRYTPNTHSESVIPADTSPTL